MLSHNKRQELVEQEECVVGELIEFDSLINYKGLLLEYLKKNKFSDPVFFITKDNKFKDHKPKFIGKLTFLSKRIETIGSNKRKVERDCYKAGFFSLPYESQKFNSKTLLGMILQENLLPYPIYSYEKIGPDNSVHWKANLTIDNLILVSEFASSRSSAERDVSNKALKMISIDFDSFKGKILKREVILNEGNLLKELLPLEFEYKRGEELSQEGFEDLDFQNVIEESIQEKVITSNLIKLKIEFLRKGKRSLKDELEFKKENKIKNNQNNLKTISNYNNKNNDKNECSKGPLLKYIDILNYLNTYSKKEGEQDEKSLLFNIDYFPRDDSEDSVNKEDISTDDKSN